MTPSAPLNVWLSALALTASVGLVWFLVASRRPAGMAKQLVADSRTGSLRELSLDRSAAERLASAVLDRLRDISSTITPLSVAKETSRRIARAGLSDRWTADRLIALKGLISLGVFLVFFLLAVTSGAPYLLILAIALAAIGYFIPDLLLVRRGAGREMVIQRELADVTDQILIAVEAGASLDTAIDHITRDSDRPLQAEFRRMLQDVAFGLSRKEALTSMVSRTSVPELREMLLAMAQSEEHGLSIGNILRVQAAEIRDKRKSRAEEAALKVPVKIVFPLILCILPCLLAVIIGPAVVQISQNLNF